MLVLNYRGGGQSADGSEGGTDWDGGSSGGRLNLWHHHFGRLSKVVTALSTADDNVAAEADNPLDPSA